MDHLPCDSKFGLFMISQLILITTHLVAVPQFKVSWNDQARFHHFFGKTQGAKRIGSPTCGRPGPLLGASFEVLSRMRNNATDD